MHSKLAISSLVSLVAACAVSIAPRVAADEPIPANDAKAAQAVLDDKSNDGLDHLDDLERDAFSHNYTTNSAEQRICRLEQFVFGKQFNGDLNLRFKKLRKALKPREASHFSVKGLNNNAADSVANMPSSSTAQTELSNLIPPKIVTPPAAPVKARVSVIEIMNRGIDNYNRHRYSNADDDFEECCAMAPGMSRAYSYLAITKMQLNLRQAAIDAFRMSMVLDPFGTYGRYARGCLIILAGDEAVRKGPPIDSRKILDTAMSNIDKQSSDMVSRHKSAGEQIATSRLVYRPGTSYVESRMDSNTARNDGALRAAHAAESANNLKHILAVKHMKGDANLRAWGTSLTSRYYGNETYLNAPYYIPKEQPMELKAIVQSLNSSHKASGKAKAWQHIARSRRNKSKH